MKSFSKFLADVFFLAAASAVFFSAAANAMPTQEWEDTNTWPHSAAVNGLSGVASRPFVTDLSVTFEDGTSKVLLSGLTAANGVYSYQTGTGSVTPVIYANNLCTPSSSGGTCYTTPNRIQVSFNCNTPSPLWDGKPDFNTTDCTNFINATFDVTINTNAYFDRAEWYYMTGELAFYS